MWTRPDHDQGIKEIGSCHASINVKPLEQSKEDMTKNQYLRGCSEVLRSAPPLPERTELPLENSERPKRYSPAPCILRSWWIPERALSGINFEFWRQRMVVAPTRDEAQPEGMSRSGWRSSTVPSALSPSEQQYLR